MGRGFRIFLVCLLGFCVLFGAFCIVWPLVHQPEADGPADLQPPSEQPDDSVREPPDPDAGAGYAPEESTATAATEAQLRAQALVQDMTLREKVYQLFIVTPEALTGVNTATAAGEATRAAIEAQPVGGIIYFSKNLVDREQAAAMLANTQSYSKIPLLLSVDEEGGMVSRVGANPAMGTTSFSNMADYGEAADPQKVYEIGETLGSELLALGFNLDFAPVADVVTNPANTEIGRRSFSSDPYVAARMVGSMVSGMKDAGILSTLKHFPGHGGTAADTHNGISVTNRTLEEMRQAEFLPFQAGMEAGAPMVMVGHLSAAAVNGDNTPSDLSKRIVTEVLRQELGFEGVIVTDAQNMGAITDAYSSAEAAVGALEAGVDLILMPADLTEAADGVLAAVADGRLSNERINESVIRILAMKYDYGILS